jgi:hypothetical protein
MKRVLTLTTAAAVALGVPTAAVAHTKGAHRAKVQRATLAPVAPYGLGSGKAQMTANRHNAKVSLHVKGLSANTTYDWKVLEGDCATGSPVTGLTYKALKTNDSGVGNSKASSKKNAFAFSKTATYSVAVYNAGTDTQVLCGTFKAKAKKPKKPKKTKS